jgi:multidrug efflux system membrane fusion protein
MLFHKLITSLQKRRAAAAVPILVAAILAGCDRTKEVAAPLPAPVTAAVAERRDVPHQLTAIGSVEAYSTVSVKTQTTGELTGVFFKEGDDVKKGQLLFTLDKRQVEAAIRRAEGMLAHDEAQAENDRVQARRYEALWKEGVASKEQHELMLTAADAADAAVRADRGTLEDAKVQLTYCSIYSPINGRTGNLIVHQGNMIKANDVPALVNINQVQPIYVTFTVPEKFLPEIRNRLQAGKPHVQALAPNDTAAPARGELSFIDNGVDATTGTIKLKAEFVNAERRLWPGQFVNVSMNLGKEANAVVVPSQALQTGQQGQFVYVIKSDMSAEVRPVTAGETNDGFTVIKQGVESGERVVTDGQLRLAPGLRVEIKGGPGSFNGTQAGANQPGTAGSL